MKNRIYKMAKRIGLLMILMAALTIFAAAAEVTGNTWIFPVTDYTSLGCEFGCECTTHAAGSLGYHPGYDLRGSKNTMIVATRSGTVVAANNDCDGSHLNSADDCDCGNAAGNYVKIKHADGVYTIYFHMNKSAVKKGDWVEQGDIIGYVGRTGNATGYHTCMEYRTGTGSGQSTATEYVNTIVSDTASKNGTGDQFGPSLRKTTISTNLLVKPSKDSTVVTVIPAGTEVLCTIVQEHWGFVNYNGQKGWVNMKTNTEEVEKAFQFDYYSSGGSGKMSNTTVVLADEMQHSVNKFTKSGYYHNGWWIYLSKSNQFLYTDGTDYAWYVKGEQDEGWSRVVFRDKEAIDGKALEALDNKQLITLWSYWKEGTPADFTIVYHANGGTGTMEDMAARRGAKNVFSQCAFENPGYEFAGWTAYRESDNTWQYVLQGGGYQWYELGSEPDGAVLRVYEDGAWTTNTTAVDGDIVHLYAQWEEDPDAEDNWAKNVYIYHDTVNIQPGITYWLGVSWSGGGDDMDFTWSSSDESVVTVNQYGDITALKEGTATVTVTANDGGGVSDTCRVVVSDDCYESAHPYKNEHAVWVIREEGAEELSVTFDSRTYFVEDDGAFICLYDGENQYIGEYTDTQLANETITVQGDTISVRLLCGYGSADGWGFAITKINDREIMSEADKIDITGANMTLGNDLRMNFLIKKSEIPEGCTAMVSQAGGEAVEVELTSYNSVYYGASYSVAAKEMTDVLSVEIYNPDGVLISKPFERTIKQYAMTLLGASSSSDELKTVIVDMLNYGTQAQKYFGYHEDAYANAELTDEQAAYATADVEPVNRQQAGTSFMGANLSLEDSILLNVFFDAGGQDVSTMYATIDFVDYKGNTMTDTVAVETYGSTMAKVVIDQIVLADTKRPVTVKLYHADGTVLGECVESVESYVARNLGSASVGAINMSIVKFATSAYNYLGGTN